MCCLGAALALATLAKAVFDSVQVSVALQVPPQVVEAGVCLGADLAVVWPHT